MSFVWSFLFLLAFLLLAVLSLPDEGAERMTRRERTISFAALGFSGPTC